LTKLIKNGLRCILHLFIKKLSDDIFFVTDISLKTKNKSNTSKNLNLFNDVLCECANSIKYTNRAEKVNAFVCIVVALLAYENYKGKQETDIFFLLKVKYSKDKHSV
jgi:hypothetical protein